MTESVVDENFYCPCPTGRILPDLNEIPSFKKTQKPVTAQRECLLEGGGAAGPKFKARKASAIFVREKIHLH